MATIPTEHSKSVNCDKYASIKVGTLRTLLEGVPDDADLKITGMFSSQRDGDSNGKATVSWRS